MYISGMSSTTDFAGVADAGLPVGVQTQDISSIVEGQIAAYTSAGGRCFVDSGAFRAMTKGVPVDFPAVLSLYARLARMTDRPENLAVVAPDVIGVMDATARLQLQHLGELTRLKETGVELMIPLQRGWEPSGYVEHISMLSEKLGEITVAFACNLAAWRPRDISQLVAILRPARVHLQGVGKKNLDRYSDAVRWQSPSTAISCDANRTRAMVGQGRRITETVRRKCAAIARRRPMTSISATTTRN